MNTYERLTEAIQAVLDGEGDGWTLSHWITIMGIERMNSDGEVDTAVWITKPQQQAEYVTDGLITAAFDARNEYSDD